MKIRVGYSLFPIIILFIFMVTPVVGQDEQDQPAHTPSYPFHFSFPETPHEIEKEVNDTIRNAEKDIATLYAFPQYERNETNTLIELENILTRADQHLIKYQTLASLYPDSDMREAAAFAAETRTLFFQNISSRTDLYDCIKDVTPVTDYGRWLRDEEISFFTFGGAALSEKERNHLNMLYSELTSLETQYLRNIRENRPVTENLHLIEQTAKIRNEIAVSNGFENWMDFLAKREGWDVQSSEIISILDTIASDVREMLRLEMNEMLLKKGVKDINATIVSDYEIQSYLNRDKNQAFEKVQILHEVSSYQVVKRSLHILSCLMHIKTELVPNARVYAPGVQLYRISEADNNNTLGWFYLDLTERDGKTTEWMTALIGNNEERNPGTRTIQRTPVFLLSGILDNETGKRSITSSDITQLFHELGHLYIRVLADSSDPSPETGYIPVELTEAASHFFEKLPLTPEFSALLSSEGIIQKGPYSNSQTPPLPDKVESSGMGRSWDLAQHTIIALLDTRIAQSSGNISFIAEYTDIYSNITGAKVTDQGGYLLLHPQFSGTMTGLYWTYPVGEYYARIIYSRFQTSGFLNATEWNVFIDTLIKHGAGDPESGSRLHQLMQMSDERGEIRLTDEQNIRRYSWSYVPRCIAENL